MEPEQFGQFEVVADHMTDQKRDHHLVPNLGAVGCYLAIP
jgi:hypothetical protein